MHRAQYETAQKQAMELASKIDKGGPDTGNEMQVTPISVIADEADVGNLFSAGLHPADRQHHHILNSGRQLSTEDFLCPCVMSRQLLLDTLLICAMEAML